MSGNLYVHTNIGLCRCDDCRTGRTSLLDRILRCPGCGAWELVGPTEAKMRAADIWPFSPPCPHDSRAQAGAIREAS